MKEKKALIIAYYFPPMGMGGVQRVAKFVKYLPLFGWKPYVLTVKEVDYFAKDHSLLEDIPPDIEIIRTGSFDPLRVWFILKNLVKKGLKIAPNKENKKVKSAKALTIHRSQLFSWLFFPDNKVGWIPFALRKGLKLCRKEKFDLIFSSSPPPSLHLTGYLLKLLTKIPWIADFRDPWIGYKLESYPTTFHLFLKKRTERLIVHKADKVITANLTINRDFERRFPDTNKICLIDQGYDEEDFEAAPSSSSGIFTIGYSGTFSPDCDPKPFLSALGELIEHGAIPKDRIKFVHVGLSMGIDFDRLVEKYKVKEVVRQKGYLSHPKSLHEIKKADLLLLVTSDHPLIFPAKTFEYLRLKKPILSLLPPESPLAKFLTEMKAGKVVSPEDKDGIYKILLLYFSDFEKGRLTGGVDRKKLEKFERKNLTLKLASLFNETVRTQNQRKSG